jgi:hypothetical protein
MMTAFEGEPAMRAESAVDRITVQQQDWHSKRVRTLSARDALQALAFEAAFLHVVSVTMRDQGPLSDDDHARLVIACGRIGVIVDEVLR